VWFPALRMWWSLPGLIIRMRIVHARSYLRLRTSHRATTIADAGARDRIHITDTTAHVISAGNAYLELIRQGPLGN
jgi:hypothetical protein